MFVLLFSYVFGGAIGGSLPAGVYSYIDFLLPGILIQSTASGATQTAIGLSEDMKKRGVIDRFRSMPMAARVGARRAHAGRHRDQPARRS